MPDAATSTPQLDIRNDGNRASLVWTVPSEGGRVASAKLTLPEDAQGVRSDCSVAGNPDDCMLISGDTVVGAVARKPDATLTLTASWQTAASATPLDAALLAAGVLLGVVLAYALLRRRPEKTSDTEAGMR